MINPVAGKGMRAGQLVSIIDEFTKNGYELTIRTTQGKGDLENTFAHRASDFELLICSGGDGTLNAAITSLVSLPRDARSQIGYIPAGTVNDFARSHGIPKDPVIAAKRIAEGTPHSIDIGFFNQKIFTYVAAFGVFTNVSYETPQHMKNNLGRTAYLIEGIKSLTNINPVKMRFEYDGNVIEDEFIYGMMANSYSVGGFDMRLNRDAKFDDGLMEVTLVKHPRSPASTQKLINCLIAQKADSELLYHFQCSRLSFSAEREVSWTLDGEFGGSECHGALDVRQNVVEMLY